MYKPAKPVEAELGRVTILSLLHKPLLTDDFEWYKIEASGEGGRDGVQLD
jgi:hypothetical protein